MFIMGMSVHSPATLSSNSLAEPLAGLTENPAPLKQADYDHHQRND
jgi:hypothetical protein